MQSLQIDDLVYFYPEQYDPNIQDIITSRFEFSELASEVKEKKVQPGELFVHQQLIQRLILVLDRIFLFHKTGTGKTRAAGGSSEKLKLGMINVVSDFLDIYMKPQRTNIKRIYWLTKGKSLLKETKIQLACKSGTTEYITPAVENSTTEKQRDGNLTRALGKYYTINTYGEFVGKVIKQFGTRLYEDDGTIVGDKRIKGRNIRLQPFTEEQLRALKEEYSDCMFIIDEVQNIKEQYLGPNETYDTKRAVYQTLSTIFEIVERTKILFLSATPMINSVYELRGSLNLILPSERRIPHDFPFETATYEHIEPYLRGIISFVSESDTSVRPLFNGVRILSKDGTIYKHLFEGREYESHMLVYASEMSSIQNQAYKEFLSLNRQNIENESEAFHVNERQLSNFVYPNGKYGDAASKEYIQSIDENNTEYALTNLGKTQLLPYLKSTGNLANLSCKFAEIIRLSRSGLMYGQIVYIPNSGFYYVKDKPTKTSVTLTNIGKQQIIPSGELVPAKYPIVYGGKLDSTKDTNDPDVIFGDSDIDSVAKVVAPFIQPEKGSGVYCSLDTLDTLNVYIYIQGIGYFKFMLADNSGVKLKLMQLDLGIQSQKKYSDSLDIYRAVFNLGWRSTGEKIAKTVSEIDIPNTMEETTIKVDLVQNIMQPIYICNFGYYFVTGYYEQNTTVSLWYYDSPSNTKTITKESIPKGAVVTYAEYVSQSATFVNKVNQLAMVSKAFIQPQLGSDVIVEVDSSESSGSCFCFADYVSSGAGILSVCFSYLGFEIFSERASVFSSVSSSSGKVTLSPCLNNDSTMRTIGLDKRPRVAILGQKSPHNILELFNSYENRYGDYIKVIIGSPVSKIGINLANAVQFHLIGPAWNQTNIYQAQSRIIRATSHISLLNELREKLIIEGKDPNTARIDINIYYHAAVSSDGPSLDVNIYRTTESKEIPIKIKERQMKLAAVDRFIHSKRNIKAVQNTSGDYTFSCDYSICDYNKGYVEKPKDFTSFNVLYSDKIISLSEKYIKSVFQTFFSLQRTELINYITKKFASDYAFYPSSSLYITSALENIITNKIPLTTRFGQIVYLYEKSDIIYTDKEYIQSSNAIISTSGKYLQDQSLSIYSSILVGIKDLSLTKLIQSVKTLTDEPYIDQLIKYISDKISTVEDFDEELEHLISSLTNERKEKLFERAVERLYNEKDEKMQKVVYKLYVLYPSYIIYIKKPIYTIMYYANKRPGRGRPRNDKLPTRSLKDEPSVEIPSTDPNYQYIPNVWIQRFSSFAENKTRFSDNSKANKVIEQTELRLFEIDPMVDLSRVPSRWREPEPQEKLLYKDMFNTRLQNIKSQYSQNNVQGIISANGDFKVSDSRYGRSPGRIIETITIPVLIDLLVYLKYDPEPNLQITDFSYFYSQLLTKFDAERIQEMEDYEKFLHFKFIILQKSKNDLVNMLRTHLTQLGLVRTQ